MTFEHIQTAFKHPKYTAEGEPKPLSVLRASAGAAQLAAKRNVASSMTIMHHASHVLTPTGSPRNQYHYYYSYPPHHSSGSASPRGPPPPIVVLCRRQAWRM
jgi:hypothetical protein